MQTILQHLAEAFRYIIDSVDWVYLVMFMLTSYVILKGFINAVTERRLGIFRKAVSSVKHPWYLRTRIIVLFVGIIFAVAFGICKILWGLPWHDPATKLPYGFILFFSFIFGQFLNLYGVEVIFKGIIDSVIGVWRKSLNKFSQS